MAIAFSDTSVTESPVTSASVKAELTSGWPNGDASQNGSLKCAWFVLSVRFVNQMLSVFGDRAAERRAVHVADLEVLEEAALPALDDTHAVSSRREVVRRPRDGRGSWNRSSGQRAVTTGLGTSTISAMRRSTATEQRT